MEGERERREGGVAKGGGWNKRGSGERRQKRWRGREGEGRENGGRWA